MRNNMIRAAEEIRNMIVATRDIGKTHPETEEIANLQASGMEIALDILEMYMEEEI